MGTARPVLATLRRARKRPCMARRGGEHRRFEEALAGMEKKKAGDRARREGGVIRR